MITVEKERAEEGASYDHRKVPRKIETGHNGDTSDCAEGAEEG